MVFNSLMQIQRVADKFMHLLLAKILLFGWLCFNSAESPECQTLYVFPLQSISIATIQTPELLGMHNREK